MYRAVGLAFIQEGIPPTQEGAEALLPDVHLDVEHENGALQLMLNGQDVTDAIRTREVGSMASAVAMLQPVREKLVAEQRRIGYAYAVGGGVVIDGRDIGTVVFPEADVKIFMTAGIEERARRRQEDLSEQGTRVPFDEVLEEIRRRDRQDQQRDLAPLRQAEDAVLLDTTNRSFDEQVQFVIDRVRERENNTLV